MGQVHIFGIRHLSPAGAFHVIKWLEEINPKLVLIEGPSDFHDQMSWFCDRKTKPPIAILAYTKESPIQTILYPLAEYSPEYQAICWAKQHGVACQFMDLPSSVFLAFQQAKEKRREGEKEQKLEEVIEGEERLYEKLGRAFGEEEESFWERRFEQLETAMEYQKASRVFGKELRDSKQESQEEWAETLVREAYMKRVIQKAIEAGRKPEEIVCICGAYHVIGLEENEPMSDEEERRLPRLETNTTLMPYSYYRLSRRSGYGAGNQAPAYFEMLWNAWNDKDKKETVYSYFTQLASSHRKAGNLVSSAELIEAVRLSYALAELRGSCFPTRRDLRDAAITCMGHGNLSEISIAVADTEIGTKIGSLPSGVSRTSIQEDFYQQLKRLKLEKYLGLEQKDLDLDLRENLRVKSEESAFLDLNRSFFLHRMYVLGITFAKPRRKVQDGANWGEYWTLSWTPESEIQIVESALLGDTIESAVSFLLKERAEESEEISEVAKIFSEAFFCGIPKTAFYTLSILQRISVDTKEVGPLSKVAEELSIVIRYGDLRKFHSEELEPLLEQLYIRACLAFPSSCICDRTMEIEVMEAMERLNKIQINHSFLEEERWIQLMTEIANRDDLNTKCSGFAMAILLERGKVDNHWLSTEIAKRLSKGMPVDLGAGWFEGLAKKNHYTLIGRLSLWQGLSEYMDELDWEEMKRALVFLRRAFSDFSANEKSDIAENLGEIWGLHAQEVAEVLMEEPTKEEQEMLSELEDFDFFDI